jgi:hypothetical protein
MRFPFLLFTAYALMIVAPEPARDSPTKLGNPAPSPVLQIR